MNNRDIFQAELTGHLTDLFATDQRYAFVASRDTPAALAERQVSALAAGKGAKDGDGCKLTCKALGIKHTYKAIAEYLNA